MRNKIFGLFALLGFVLAVGKAWYFVRDGFSLSRIVPFFYEKEYRSALPVHEVKEAFDQSYRYLDRGRQCYAFESADGKYVLKLPRFDHFRVPFLLRALPFSNFREAVAVDKQKRHRFLLDSFHLVQEELQEETGLLYMHLGKTDFLGKKIRITDQLGRRFWLDLDQAVFALQKKEELLMPMLFEHLRKGEKEKAKELFDAFLQLMETCKQKGISNKDQTLLNNFGYDGERVLYVDIGSFYRKEEALK